MISPSFRRLLAATGLSDAANGVFSVAAVIIASQVSRSPMVVGAITVASTLPWLVLAIPAGILVDSVDRRRAITVANVTRGLLMLLLAALLTLDVPVALLLVLIVFAVATVQTVVDTAAETLIPEMVPPEDLTRANGAISVSTRISYQFAGPLFAGVLVGVAIEAPAWAAGAACLVAALLLGRISTPYRVRQEPGERQPVQFLHGLRTIARRPVLGTMVGVGALTTLANAAFHTVFVLYAIAPGPLGMSPGTYGLVIGMIGVGAALGSLLTARFERLVGQEHLLWLTRVGWATVFAAPLVVSQGVWLGLVMALGSVFGGMWSVQAMSVRQRTVPGHERGQIAGASRMMSYGATPLGAALGGVAGGLLDTRVIFVLCALTSLVAIVPIRRWMSAPALRRAELQAAAA
ncbi:MULTISPECIES: MFS transporter [unclassified Micromonospora]|uniref:MFS transporter n=1 Tax=unclassified Micromonospora TaxID=2617518 RepID=UPI000E30746C|nr:MFS transporter [Micromonospora sp. B006]AXO35398.1 hypothetical protein MicB006_3117 [Micromonospora sp. B006]